MAEPRLMRYELAGLVLLGLVALLVRLQLVGTPPYFDEGPFFHFSAHPWRAPENLHSVSDPEFLHRILDPLPWYRPAHFLLLWPGAAISFTGFRVLFAVYASVAAPLAAGALRRSGTSRTVAAGTGLLVALEPNLVVWGAHALPDAMMLSALLATVWAHQARRPMVAGALACVSIWIKESAVVLVLLLLVDATRRARANRPQSIWPLELTRLQTSYAYAILVGLMPMALALTMGGSFPGGGGGTYGPALLEEHLLVVWCLPFLLLGLTRRRTRLWAALGLAYPAFYALYAGVLGQGLNLWYRAAPNAFVLVASGFIVDRLWRVSSESSSNRRLAAQLAAAGLAALFVIHGAAPASQTKAVLLKPLGRVAERDLPEALDFDRHADAELWSTVEGIALSGSESLLVVDLYWGLAVYPLSAHARNVLWDQTGERGPVRDAAPWADAVEHSDATLLEKKDTPMNEALRAVYADCAQTETSRFVVIHGEACSGRAEELRAEVDARRATTNE